MSYVRKEFLVSVIIPRKKYKNEKALNLSTDFFNFCYLHGKINPYVVLTHGSMDLDAVTHFSDSLLVMFSVTSRHDRPKRRPSWSIFWVHSPFWESRPYDKISESCDRRVNGKRPPAVLQHHLVFVKFSSNFAQMPLSTWRCYKILRET